MRSTAAAEPASTATTTIATRCTAPSILHKGIVQSCDVFFYNVGNKLGIDRIAQYAELAGIGHKTGIDLPHEAEGVMPSTRWKARNLPPEMVRRRNHLGRHRPGRRHRYAAAVGGGHRRHCRRRRLASASPGEGRAATSLPARQGDLNPENIQKVIYGMYGVVNEGGTGGAPHPGHRSLR